MGKALTWQQVLCVILFMPMLVFAGMGFGQNRGSTEEKVGRYGVGIAAPLFAILLGSHIRSNWRKDVQPDVLAGLVTSSQIYQLGSAHFVATVRQQGDHLRLMVLIQNTLDGQAEFRLSFKSTVSSLEVPSLDVMLPPAQVVHAALELPLQEPPKPFQARLFLSGSCSGS